MKSRLKQSRQRFVIGSSLALIFTVTVYAMTAVWLRSRAAEIKTTNNRLMIGLPDIVRQLAIRPVQSLQWFLLQPNQAVEYTPQQGGIANSWPKPLPPTTVVVADTRLGQSVVVSWQAVPGQTYDGVEMYRATTNVDTVKDMTLVQTTTTMSGDWIDDSVVNDQTYYYALRSYRTTSGANITSVLTDTVSVIPTDATAPLSPRWVTVTPYQTSDSSSLQIEWEHAVSDDIITYHIYRSTVFGALGDLIQSVTPDVTTVQDESVDPGVLYYYTVTASDATGNESSLRLGTSAFGNTAPFVSSDEQAIQQINGD